MIGIGLTPEGIEQNDIMYDFMMETTWYTSPVDLDIWVSNYTHRRYGVIDEDLMSAWNLLQVIRDLCKFENDLFVPYFRKAFIQIKPK